MEKQNQQLYFPKPCVTAPYKQQKWNNRRVWVTSSWVIKAAGKKNLNTIFIYCFNGNCCPQQVEKNVFWKLCLIAESLLESLLLLSSSSIPSNQLFELFSPVTLSFINMVRMMEPWPLSSLETTIQWLLTSWPFLPLIWCDSKQSTCFLFFPPQFSSMKITFADNQQKILFICHFSPKCVLFPSILLHPHRGCLLLRSCHLAESSVWWRGDSMAGLREATKLHSSVSCFYHPALSVPGCQTIYYLILFSRALLPLFLLQFRVWSSLQDVKNCSHTSAESQLKLGCDDLIDSYSCLWVKSVLFFFPLLILTYPYCAASPEGWNLTPDTRFKIT